MRSSLVLPLIALLTRLVYGFSSPQTGALRTGSGVVSTSTLGYLGGHPELRQRRTFLSPSHPRANNNNALYRGDGVLFLPRGGGNKKGALRESASDGTERTPYKTGSKCPFTSSVAFFGSVWGTGGVLYILAKAIKRVLPIALEPFQEGSAALSQVELGAYVVTCLLFAFYEGYKGFQTKFSPLVVTRSFTLVPGKNNTAWYHYFLAPLYSMGLIHASRKRKIVSWSVTLGVAGIVAAVKRLPYPWRNIVDAGVVVGLSWGSLSILLLYIKSWVTGQPPKVDAHLPKDK